MLQQPAYSRYYLHLGEISSYPPGYKENAGIFCHTNPWIMIAEAMLGHGDQAHDYYPRINPSAREAISEVHRCEPYVYAQMIAGRDAPTHGEAKNSWLTGTAAWNYVAITQWILGIRPTFDGLADCAGHPRGLAWFRGHAHLSGREPTTSPLSAPARATRSCSRWTASRSRATWSPAARRADRGAGAREPREPARLTACALPTARQGLSWSEGGRLPVRAPLFS